jgi:hypothetical protein
MRVSQILTILMAVSDLCPTFEPWFGGAPDRLLRLSRPQTEGEMARFLKALMVLVWLLLLIASLVTAIVCIVTGQVLAAGMMLVFFAALVGIGFI